jgi:hypothetical protein
MGSGYYQACCYTLLKSGMEGNVRSTKREAVVGTGMPGLLGYKSLFNPIHALGLSFLQFTAPGAYSEPMGNFFLTAHGGGLIML